MKQFLTWTVMLSIRNRGIKAAITATSLTTTRWDIMGVVSSARMLVPSLSRLNRPQVLEKNLALRYGGTSKRTWQNETRRASASISYTNTTNADGMGSACLTPPADLRVGHFSFQGKAVLRA
jgi:hypothetical protein